MGRAIEKSSRQLLEAELGTIRKKGKNLIRIALVYPNSYHMGMSNLGFQTTYGLLNKIDGVACERCFLPHHQEKEVCRSIESGRRLTEFHIVAFSVSFENDYPNILTILDLAGIPLRSGDRDPLLPIVIAGGVACMINPEPIAPFIDCFLIGEAESLLDLFMDAFTAAMPDSASAKRSFLISVAQNLTGAYVPAFYEPEFHPDGTLAAFKAAHGAPDRVLKSRPNDLNKHATKSEVLTPNTAFDDTYLLEVGRGCPHGCRFCAAGFIYRPPRFRSMSSLKASIDEGLTHTAKIGLVSPAVSDHPFIKDLCAYALGQGAGLSFSSFRAGAVDPSFSNILKQGGTKTATIAPDAGSERMRKVINKGLTEKNILQAAETLVKNGIPNLKLYFMIGLPTETLDDVDEVVALCKKIKHVFLKASREKKRIGDMTVSLNAFVPKPFTPFQWAPMDPVSEIKFKIKRIKTALKKVPNVRVHADVPRWAYIQALLSRGDRKVSEILLLAHKNRGNWARTLKETPHNPDFYVHRERHSEELFPWDFIDHGIRKSFLRREYRKALDRKTSPPCPGKSCHICGVCPDPSGR